MRQSTIHKSMHYIMKTLLSTWGAPSSSSSFEFIWRLANQYGALPPPTVCFRASMEVIRYKLCKRTKVNKQNHMNRKQQIKL